MTLKGRLETGDPLFLGVIKPFPEFLNRLIRASPLFQQRFKRSVYFHLALFSNVFMHNIIKMF
jgi:hypothetical protein